jgi:hypothetical protein
VTVTSACTKFDEASDKVNVTVSETLFLHWALPERVTDTVGAAVSYEMPRALLAVLPLPAASVNVPAATEIDAEPDCVFAVGVNVAV